MAHAVRDVLPTDAHFVYAASDGLDPTACLHSRIGMVALLCSPKAMHPSE